MLSAVIFDMDGVIIDSEPLHAQVVIDMMQDFGVSLEMKDMDRFVGNTNATLWKTLIAEFDLPVSLEELGKTQHRQNLETLKKSNGLLIDGVKPLLEEIKSANHGTAIASSSNKEFITSVVDKFELGTFFDYLVSGQEVKNSKPAPDIFLEAVSRLGVSPEDCVVIEDSNHGVAAANAAGIKVVGFVNPNSGNQDLSKADKIVHSMADISLELMKNLVE